MPRGPVILASRLEWARPETRWWELSACSGMPLEVFYPEHRHGATRARLEAEAVEVCSSCPVRVTCLDAALREEDGNSLGTRHGVRGALTAAERLQLAAS